MNGLLVFYLKEIFYVIKCNFLSIDKHFFDDALTFFQYDAYSEMVKQWNELRRECLHFAFYKLLYPMLRVELRNKLRREAKDGLISTCRNSLYNWLKIGKFEVEYEEEDEDDWGSKNGCRIMAVMYENDFEIASYAVVINTEGTHI